MSEPIITCFALFLVGGLASFLCASTGGAGLISTPALIFFGLSPQSAIATDLLAMLGGALSSFYRFYRAGRIDFRLGSRLMLVTAAGAFVGGRTLLSMDEALMRKIMAALLLIILGIVLLRGKLQPHAPQKISIPARCLGFVLFFMVGFWGTFFGAGFLIFASYTLTLLFGKSLLESAGILSLIGLTVGGIAVAVYSQAGMVVWSYCLAIALGKALGSFLGADFAMKKGEVWVRSIFIVVVVASSAKLLL